MGDKIKLFFQAKCKSIRNHYPKDQFAHSKAFIAGFTTCLIFMVLFFICFDFEKYQTFVVGIIGFIGVILTISVSSNLAKKQHEQQIFHKQKALRVALHSELEMNMSTFKDRITSIKGARDRAGYMPTTVYNNAYLGLLGDIGLLSIEEIKSIMKAYLLIAELPIRLKLLGKDIEQPPEHIFIPSTQLPIAREIHEVFIVEIDAALKLLQSKLNIDR